MRWGKTRYELTIAELRSRIGHALRDSRSGDKILVVTGSNRRAILGRWTESRTLREEIG